MSGETAEEALRRIEARFRAFVNASTDVVYSMNADWTELRALDGRGFIRDTDAPRRNWIEDYIDPADQPLVRAAIAEAIRTRATFELEHRIRRVDGSLGWTLSRAVPLFDEEGRIVEWFGAARDVTARRAAEEALISSTPDLVYAFDRDSIFTPITNAAGDRRAEQHLKLLLDELNHRVKNTLATVQSIATQTFRGDAADPQARAAFEARLIALSEAHTILTRTNWEGASLREIAAQAVAPFRAGAGVDDRVRLDGDDIQLRPQTAVALAMALHELASNAAKFGALSGGEGAVALGWRLDEGRLGITWEEAGGPQVAPPGRRGFGARLIEQGLARELNGSVRLDYRTTGVVCTIDVPVVQGENNG